MAEGGRVLDVAGVSKRFAATEVLSDVSSQVGKGETVCVLGPSGSGKSTLLRCINWLERPDVGQIHLNGGPVGVTSGGVVMNDRRLSRIRTRIGMVFQHFALWPHLTVLQNLMEAPVQVQRRPKPEIRDEALPFLPTAGLSDTRDPSPPPFPAAHNPPLAVAPYSHAVDAGTFLFVPGQLATDPDDDALPIPPGIEAQTHKVMDNLARVLKGCGLSFANVVQVRIFLTDFNADYAKMNDIYATYFAADRRPARTTVGVTALARGGLVEIDMIAMRP